MAHIAPLNFPSDYIRKNADERTLIKKFLSTMAENMQVSVRRKPHIVQCCRK
ncbi:hypothetical protein OBV_46030 [Oscillibacter valericigenes Sjm18-20]|nr:hypothetical protein OBV_46030 [Oscillibacter valericigenes Sjm18-20]